MVLREQGRGGCFGGHWNIVVVEDLIPNNVEDVVWYVIVIVRVATVDKVWNGRGSFGGGDCGVEVILASLTTVDTFVGSVCACQVLRVDSEVTVDGRERW